jgi:hypothetical protein
MLTNTWRRLRSPAAWAFLMIVGAPMLAEAQQGGLFPLAPVRRQRVPCPMEDPTFGLYRQEYYGYFPTCWRRFPPGWGCPSPEAPNPAASFKERPRDPLPDLRQPGDEPNGAPGDRGNAPMEDPRGGTELPRVPSDNSTSPFQLDRPGDRTAPRPDRNPPPPADSNPLDLPGPVDGAKPTKPKAGDVPPPTGLIEQPAAPGLEDAPLLALPDPVAPPAAPTSPFAAPGAAALPPPTVLGPGASAFETPAPAQAPRRTSLLGGLFGGMGRRRR